MASRDYNSAQSAELHVTYTSASESPSESTSLSPSASESPSESPSESASLSSSASESPSESPSESFSLSPSASESPSESASASPTEPPFGYGTDLTPGQTYDASDFLATWGLPEFAFNGNITKSWVVNGTSYPQWIEVLFSSSKVIRKLTVRSINNVNYAQTVKTFDLEASDDGDFTGEEVTLLTVDTPLSWTQNELKTWEFLNDTNYLYYRLHCYSGGSIELNICEIEMMAAGVSSESPSESPSESASESPSPS